MIEVGALPGPALLIASALLHASWNAMLKRTSVVLAQVIAVLMGERLPRRQLAGAALVVLGASLVARR